MLAENAPVVSFSDIAPSSSVDQAKATPRHHHSQRDAKRYVTLEHVSSEIGEERLFPVQSIVGGREASARNRGHNVDFVQNAPTGTDGSVRQLLEYAISEGRTP